MWTPTLVTLVIAAGTPAISPPQHAISPRHCVTLDKLRQPHHQLTVAFSPLDATGALATRDAFGDFAKVRESDHFALKWGPNGSFDGDADAILAALEEAWQVEVVELGFLPPRTTEAFKMNVYIGDTGGDAPSAEGAGGYFWYDPEGFPHLVLSRESAHGGGGWTAAHELFHAVQDRYASYQYDGLGGWFWEATAEWAASHVLPDDGEHGSFLGGYALLPHLSVSHFDYPDTGALEEYHHYGAFILARFIDEVLDDPGVIRATWENDDGKDDPLLTLADVTAARGADLRDLFGLFAVSQLDWSGYQHASRYADNVVMWADYLPDDDHRVAATHERATEGLVDAPANTLPRRFGIDVVKLELPADGAWRVRFQGAAAGDRGTPSDWAPHVVITGSDGAATDLPLKLDGAVGSVLLDLTQTASVALVVPQLALAPSVEERFPFSYALERPVELTPQVADELADVDDDAIPAFGCASGGAPGALVLALVALARRRRRC